MNGTKVLITGATGFIGGRLAEKLVLDHGAGVRALVRDFAHAARIARFPVEMIAGDFADDKAVEHAVAGSDVVVNCAYDTRHPDRNLAGIRAVAEACRRHGIERLVHVSSMSVYEPLSDGILDESSPAEVSGWEYPDTKLAVEREVLRYADEHGLRAVVLQPTIVYGPFSAAWTMWPLQQLRTGQVVLPDNGGGLCNAVYVDDVVDAIILAAQSDAAVGERLLVSGAAPVTWRGFFGAYERMLGVEAVTLRPSEELGRLARADGVSSGLALLRHDPRRILRWPPVRRLSRFARLVLGEALWKRADKTLPPQWHLPSAQLLALYRARASASIEKARRVLGYEPKFDFDRGMGLTGRFAEWANL